MRSRLFPPPTGSVLLAVFAAGCGEKTPAEQPSVVLLTLDTTRADALGCYGGPADATPALDRLAREGVLFEAAHTTVPITLPAHASLLTGLYPPRHGVRNNAENALPEAAETLAELARESGYATAAFVASAVLDAPFGLAQGFDVYDVPEEDERPAAGVVDAGLRWLRRLDPDEPFFLWLHFYDPHTPYEPPPGAPELPAAPPERVDYLREVAAMDREIGRFLGELEGLGRWEDSLVVAVGDHGEAFGEHGEKGHTIYCYEPTLQVPLLVRLPGGARAGERVQAPVSVVDVLPTVARLLDWPASADLDGVDLLKGGAGKDGLYFESYYGYLAYGWSPLAGWLDADGKYIHSSDPELFDLARDPAEEHNLLARDGAPETRPYQRAIAEVASRNPLPASEADVDEDLLERVRGLGYATVGAGASGLPHPLAEHGLPSPRHRQEAHEAAAEALRLAQEGELAEALRLFERIIAENPRNLAVLDRLASCQARLGRPADAAATLRELLRLTGGSNGGTWYRLGVCQRILGETAAAVESLRRAAELAPDDQRILREYGSALRDAGRDEEAAAVFRRLTEASG